MNEPARKKSVSSASGMRSPVYWSLLGLVIKRPGYGYQLVKRFELEYGDDLPLSSDSHIYTALNELRRRGLVEAIPGAEVIESDGRQPKPRYRATVRGLQAYRDWLCGQVREDRRQARLFLRQLAVLAHDPAGGLEVIACLEQASLEEAGHASAVSARGARSDEVSGLLDRLVSEESRLVSQVKLLFAEYARGEFEALPSRGSCRDGPAA
ncbi:MAG: PadR family transcriptional regulator [Solirubrobacteraceae bacterium]